MKRTTLHTIFEHKDQEYDIYMNSPIFFDNHFPDKSTGDTPTALKQSTFHTSYEFEHKDKEYDIHMDFPIFINNYSPIKSTRDKPKILKHSRFKHLSAGYCRIATALYIPDDLLNLITKYHGMKHYKIFCNVGRNHQWLRLKELQQLLTNINNLYMNHESMFVKTSSNELYFAGDNSNNQSGLFYLQHQKKIRKFERVPLEKQRLIVSKGICNDRYTWIYSQDTKKLFLNGTINKKTINYRCLNLWDGNKYILKKIVCEDSKSFFLMNNGDVISFSSERIGAKVAYKNVNDIEAGKQFVLLLTYDQQIICDGLGKDKAINKYFLKKIKGDMTVMSIACGAEHGGVVTSDGAVHMFGSNNRAQCGIDDIKMHRFKSVSCGANHTVFLTKEHKAYACGCNKWKQCCIRERDCIPMPEKINIEIIGLNETDLIVAVIAVNNQTIIIVDD